jgi:hypothetical protein
MWKSLVAAITFALVALGSSHAQALPTQYTDLSKEAASGMTLAAHRGNPVWRRYPHYHSQYRPYYKYNRHYGNRHYYPYYRRYYGPNWAWNYCGWGFGYWPNGCFGSGYYGGYLGGYYGDSYLDREYYPRREHVSNKKHVKWCKARYKTYNVKTDTFIGKGKRRYRCNSPYDGRR